MSQVVRRTEAELADTSGAILPTKAHVGDGLVVKSQLVLDVAPRLELGWTVDYRYWTDGYRLLVFHSTSGFSAKRDPDDLSKHGRLIIDTTTDGSRDEQPAEGTHFYTFVLHKEVFFGLAESISVLRFSETVPTAKIAIGRIRDKMELDDLLRRHRLSAVEHVATVNEAKVRRIRSRAALKRARGICGPAGGAAHIIADELADIDAIVATLAAKRKKIADLKSDEQFMLLDPEEQEAVLARIDLRLEPGAISARKDRWES
jgi:hypothetical protein